MHYKILLGLLAVTLLLLTACDSGGKFRVVNQTSYPLYVVVGDADEVTIPGGGERIFEVETESQHFFNPDVEKEVPVRLVGETYHIYDETEEAYTDSTTVYIKVGETLNAFINPNRASVKIVNNSSQATQHVFLYKHNFVAATYIADLGEVLPGESKFLRVDYATPNVNFYYYASVEMQDETNYVFGDESNILLKDQQFLMTLTDPEE